MSDAPIRKPPRDQSRASVQRDREEKDPAEAAGHGEKDSKRRAGDGGEAVDAPRPRNDAERSLCSIARPLGNGKPIRKASGEASKTARENRVAVPQNAARENRRSRAKA